MYASPLHATFSPFSREVLATLYRFPTLEPIKHVTYPATHLSLPLRRDILHRAVIYEGDRTRQGTASTKWRSEVHGSGKKIRPQKGTGNARLGDKKSPMLRGGGVAFGPRPRDFSTKLPRKVYDLAWRTALSYRYKKGELFVMQGAMNLPSAAPEYLKMVFGDLGWGNLGGRSMVVRKNGRMDNSLSTALKEAPYEGECKDASSVDVKDLLSLGRIVMEKAALDQILEEHQSDLVERVQVPRSFPTATTRA